MFYKTIFINRIFTKGTEDLIKNNICSFGNSLILADKVSAIVIAFGNFGDSGAPIRISVVDSDMNKVNSCLEILKDIIKNHISDFSFEISENEPSYINRLKGIEKDYDIFNMSGFIPPLSNLNQVTEDMLWMSKFFDRVYEIKEGYVLLVLRPMIKAKDGDEGKGSPLYKLLRAMYMVSDIYRQEISKILKGEEEVHIDLKNKNFHEDIHYIEKSSYNQEKNGKGSSSMDENRKIKKSENTEENTIKTYNLNKINLLFQKNLEFIYSALTSGAWWLSIYIVSKPYSQLIRLMGIYWSFIAKIGNLYSDKNDIYGRKSLVYKKVNEIAILEDLKKYEPNDKELSIYKTLKKYEVDLLYFIKRNDEKIDEDETIQKLLKENNIDKILENITVPYIYEIPVTGNRISSVFQFPHYSTPLISVESGFDYCFKNIKDLKSPNQAEIGKQIESLIENESKNIATININDLTKHMLIVGTTGSGKTNSVITIVNSIKKKSPDTKVFILEGAKREYRKYNLKNFEVIDLIRKYININIFAHPSFISFETHISNICNIINSCLELPTPLPALMSEAIYRAYISYITNDNERLKNKNPILFFLFKAVMDVVNKAGYGGEIGSNIDAAIRTRLRQFLTGATGKVLDCNDDWNTICKNILDKDSIVELESIGDNRVRSFIMSLFALYYRYAVEEDYRRRKKLNDISTNNLNRLIVLEEAHRIIGKGTVARSFGENTTASGEHLEMFSNMLSEIRAFNCGIVISDQSPSKLIPDSIKNTNTKLIMKLVASDDIKAVVESSGLPDDAIKDIPKLSTGQAILLTGSEKPSLIKVNEAKLNILEDDIEIKKDEIEKDMKYQERSFVFIDLLKDINLVKNISDEQLVKYIKLIENKVKDFDKRYRIYDKFTAKCKECFGAQRYNLLFSGKRDIGNVNEFKNIINELGRSIKSLEDINSKLKEANISDDLINKMINSLKIELSSVKNLYKKYLGDNLTYDLENKIDEKDYENISKQLPNVKALCQIKDDIIKRYESQISVKFDLNDEEKRKIILDTLAIFYELME